MSGSFPERLQAIIDYFEVKQKDFAEACGVTESTLSGYLKGIREPKVSVIAKLLCEFNISGHWLLTGQGEMLIGKATTSEPESRQMPVQHIGARDIMKLLQDYVLRTTGEALPVDVGLTVAEPAGVRILSITIGTPRQVTYSPQQVSETDYTQVQEDQSDYLDEDLPRKAGNDLKS